MLAGHHRDRRGPRGGREPDGGDRAVSAEKDPAALTREEAESRTRTAGARDRPSRRTLSRKRRARGERMPSTTRCAGATTPSRPALPRSGPRRQPVAPGRGRAVFRFRQGRPCRADAVAGQRIRRRRRDRFLRPHPAASSGSRRTRRWRSWPSRRSMGCRSRSATRTEGSSSARLAATARWARNVTRNLTTLDDVPGRLRGAAPAVLEVRGEVYMRRDDFLALNRGARGRGRSSLRQPPQRRRRFAASARSRDHCRPAASALRLRAGRA